MKEAKTGIKKKTALVLSGGGSRGAYQIGVWQALIELGWTFDMVIGVSVGSLNGAMVVQEERLVAENLWRELETDNVFDVSHDAQPADFAIEFIRQGGAVARGLRKFVDTFLDEDRVRKASTDFGLVVVEFPSMRPLYLWKKDIPKGKLGDFIMASSSAYPAIQTYEIDGKRYIDGGFENVLPIHMAVENGATDIVAVYLDAAGRFDKEREFASLGDSRLIFIQPKWDLGHFLIFNKKNTSRIIRLGYLDAMKEFGVYDGKYYSFIKGEFDKRSIRGVDMAAKCFELDPLVLYSKPHLLNELKGAVEEAKIEHAEVLKLGKKVLSKETLDLRQARDLLIGYNRKALVLIIARDIIEKKEASIFVNKYLIRMLGDEIAAARFIDRAGLL